MRDGARETESGTYEEGERETTTKGRWERILTRAR
jgi:hypothetical protein